MPRAPEIHTSKFSGVLNTMQRFESSSIHHFWDTPQHFLKTHVSLQSGFALFLELQKSLLVSFQGCWTQCQRFESFTIHCFWDTPLHFLKTCFNLENGYLLFLELQKSILVSFRDAEHNAKGLKSLAFTVSEILHCIFSKHIFPYKVASCHA